MTLKLNSCIIALLFCNSFLYGQKSLVDIKIIQPKYKRGTSELLFNLEFVNNSKDTLTLIKPLSIFFDRHFEFNVYDYPQLSAAPYKADIELKGECLDEEMIRESGNLVGEKQLTENDLFILYPKQSKTFKDIKLEIENIQFCSSGEYRLKIAYLPQLNQKVSAGTTITDKLILPLTKIANKLESKVTKCSAQ